MSEKHRRPASVSSIPSTDMDDGDNIQDLSITVNAGGNGEDSSDQASFSFIPLAGGSPIQRRRRSYSATKGSDLSATPSGASTPTGTGKLDLAARRRIRESPSDIENSYFRQFWSRYLKGYERVLVSDILNKFLKDLATSSSSYDNGEAFSSDELIKFFRPAPRGKGDKLRETLDANGSSSLGPLKLDSTLRRFGKHATSRDILIALAEGGGPRIWPLLRSSGLDGKSSLRMIIYHKLHEMMKIAGIYALQFVSGCGATTELLRNIHDINDQLSKHQAELIAAAPIDQPVARKVQSIIYIDLNYCYTWQEAVWMMKIQLGYEGGTSSEVLYHLIQYLTSVLSSPSSSKSSVLFIIDNVHNILYEWLYHLFIIYAKSSSVVLVGRSFDKALSADIMPNITADDQLCLAEYFLQQESLKQLELSSSLSLSNDVPTSSSSSLFDSNTVKMMISSCACGNINILRFLISCPPDDIRRWIHDHDTSSSPSSSYLQLSSLNIFDDNMMMYLSDIMPILYISSAGLCTWFYSDLFDCCCISIDKFTQDECLSILRTHGLLDINKNLFKLNLSSYLLNIITYHHIHHHKPSSLSSSSSLASSYDSKLTSFWNNIMKHMMLLVSSLYDGSCGGIISHDPTSINPMMIFADDHHMDMISSAAMISSLSSYDRHRGPVASLSSLLPLIRLLLLNLIINEPSPAASSLSPTNASSEISYDGITWSFLLPSSDAHRKATNDAILSSLIPSSLRESYLLNKSYISTIIKLLHIIADDKDIYEYLLKLRQIQALYYQQHDLESYKMYPDRSLTQEAPVHPDHDDACEMVILAMISCLIRLHRYDDADMLMSRCLSSLQQHDGDMMMNDDSVNIDTSSSSLSPVKDDDHMLMSPSSHRAAVLHINDDDDIIPDNDDMTLDDDHKHQHHINNSIEYEHGIMYHERYLFKEDSIAEMQAMWLRGVCYHLRCLSQADSFKQLSLFNPYDKKVLQRQIEEQGLNTVPKPSPILILDTLLQHIDIEIDHHLHHLDDDHRHVSSPLASSYELSSLYVLKLKSMMLQADHQAGFVLSIYSKRNIHLYLSQQSALSCHAGSSSIITMLYRDIRSVDASAIRRVEGLLSMYDDILKLLHDGYHDVHHNDTKSKKDDNDDHHNEHHDEEDNMMIVEALDELLIIKFKCLLLVRCGDMLLSLRRYSDAQKVFDRVTVYCKDIRYRKYLMHSLIYAQAISGHAMILMHAKQSPSTGPSPQSLLAIEMLREAYYSCTHASPAPAARHMQLHILYTWSNQLILSNRVDSARALLYDDIKRLSYDIEILSSLSYADMKIPVIGYIRAMYPLLVSSLSSINREQQLVELGGTAGMIAANKMLSSFYHHHIDIIKAYIQSNDVTEALLILYMIEQINTTSSSDTDIYYLDDEEDEIHHMLEEDDYMEQATSLVYALDIFRVNYSQTSCDSMLHGISLILRRQAKVSLYINRSHSKKIEMAKSSLESVMDIYRDMGGIGFVIDLADVQAELGRVLASNNEQSEAISLYTQALDLYRPLYGDHDILVGEYSYRKAVALQDLKLYEDSEPFVKDAIAIFNNLPPGTKKGRALAACYSIKGFLHQELEEYDEAKESYKVALQICGRMYGKEGIEMSAHVAKIFNNLASVATSLGDMDEARSLYEATVVMLKKQNKDVSIQMLIVLENLEQLLRGEGLIDNADFFKIRVDELTEKLCDEMEKREDMLKEREKQRDEIYKQKRLEAGFKDEDGENATAEETDGDEEEEEETGSGFKCIVM